MNTITAESSLPFGKELAANEKKIRDKAVRSLRKFISTGPALSKLDLLKLWKGLFYCYWMSDKPLIQQQLAQDLGSLVLDIPATNTIPFLEAFWDIHCQQWHGLDRLRLDKFYMLLRRIVFYSFLYLANQDWNAEAVEAYTNMLLEGPMHPTDRKKPDAIRFHIIDIYFEELDKVLELQREQDEDIHLDEDAITRPLKVTAVDNVNKVTRKKAKEALAVRYRKEEEQEEEEQEEQEEEEELEEEEQQQEEEEEEEEQEQQEETVEAAAEDSGDEIPDDDSNELTGKNTKHQQQQKKRKQRKEGKSVTQPVDDKKEALAKKPTKKRKTRNAGNKKNNAKKRKL